jgi:hypothetical protein
LKGIHLSCELLEQALLSSKQVLHVETMVAGVGLTQKSQSTNLLGDTSGDWAEYVDSLGVSFQSTLKTTSLPAILA